MFLGDDNAAISEEECSSSPVPAPRSAAPQEQPSYENVTLEAAPAAFDNEGNDISQQVPSPEETPAQETAEPEQHSPVVNRSRTSSTRFGH